MKTLSMDLQSLQTARSGLIKHGLIAWREPIYQVLSLEPANNAHRTGGGMSLGDILKTAREVKND
jgi:hypothetical protein